jgi:hypothetical protein
MPRQPIIYVDADACPVKAEILRIADRAGVVTVLVANGGLRPSRDPMVRTVIVPQGADIADDWIVENCVAGDIVVTADIPLARRSVEKGARVIGSTGRLLTPDNIGMALAMRDLKQDLRESGEIAGYNPGFAARDRSNFSSAFAQLVQDAKRSS